MAHEERSCGVIPFRRRDGNIEFLLLHSALVRNPDACWEFPKGGIEKGETELEAALRELGEESTLFNIEILPDFRDQVRYQYRRAGMEIDKTVVFFIGEVTDWSSIPSTPPSFEHEFAQKEGIWCVWANEQDATRRLFHPGMRKLLHRASLFIHEYDRLQRLRRPAS